MADSQYQHRLPQFDLLVVNVLLHNQALLLLQSEKRQSLMLFLVYNYKHLRHKTKELEQNYLFFYCEPVFTAIIDPNIFRFFPCQNEKHFLALLIYLQAISFFFLFSISEFLTI